MNKIADLYIRVSTDEQAEKGFSQRNQEEMLRKYCSINQIQIRNVIYEDHSAKTFNRPQWKKFLVDVKKYKNKINLVLFMKWDRFSRNAGDAYQMINLLRKLGVEPQAIEQPLDLSVPENKMMLAFYLAAPEVENDRRALNTFQGLRRGKKEGRHMGMAPYGYANKITEDGKKYIAIVPDKATKLIWIFEQIARNVFSTESIYQMAKVKGLLISKSNLWIILRNPLYCGKIVVPQYRDEEAKWVNGQHEAIISEGLFYRVQDVLDSKARTYRPKIKTIENFPLRGFFLCPQCGQKLTGSKCKGRSKYYYYYHCNKDCKWRVNAEIANKIFKEHLNKFKPLEAVKKLYMAVLLEGHREHTGVVASEKKKSLEQIVVYEKKLSVARNLLVTEKIDAEDYNLMKVEYNAIINQIEKQIVNTDDDRSNIECLTNSGLENLLKLGEAFENGALADSREMIGLIFPENFTFLESKFQTVRVNEIINCIYLVNNRLRAKKNGTKEDIFLLSRVVTLTGFKPVTS
ncbi:recombinase family protein [Flavobacterium sp. TAB 87]|uniref:recombinase family protein n=1 Tax=Flavobacterium sp. TAB 87 TaxID=1729581 RepID=UPI0009EBAD1F|nr:recombinase family protein [Flavobacterium sp. TAB 87]